MSTDRPADATAAHGLEEGVALALRAQDSGDWKPVADWLARNPAHARDLADFLAGQRVLREAAAPLRLPTPDRAGSALGGLELREEIGCGAAGVVYRAFDPVLKRDVAVKVLRAAGRLSAAESARFRYEAEVVASLDHPNVVPVLSSGEADGVPYLVMPLMPGGSLAGWLKTLGPDRCLPADKAAELVRDIAFGVHHAHQRGLIHRDLKPGNVLLDRDGRPHVADFGLARPADATASAAAGTPAYMAPEQARGDKHLTTAADVHALGAILFELLAGRPPFGAENVAAVLRRVLEDPAPPVRHLRPDVPRDLEAICAKCLSKDPRDRFPSAQALADALGKFLAGEPFDGGRGWVWGSVLRALGRRRDAGGMTTWGVLFWGAASTFLAMTVLQAAVLLDSPLWVSQAAVAYYLLAWLGIMWGFLVVRRDALTAVERASTAIYFGAKFSCLAVLPAVLSLHGGDPVFALPSFTALVGLGVFVHGVLYWGRFYLAGLGFFAVAAALPLVPATYWPGVYGLLLGGAQLLSGFHILRVSRPADAARGAGTAPPPSHPTG